MSKTFNLIIPIESYKLNNEIKFIFQDVQLPIISSNGKKSLALFYCSI